jgi:hypothetical protein
LKRDNLHHLHWHAQAQASCTVFTPKPVVQFFEGAECVTRKAILCGATADEIEFLMDGQRVELNAMTSDQFIVFVENKLIEAGTAKIIPPEDRLIESYRLFARGHEIKKVMEEAMAALTDTEVTIPDDLETGCGNISKSIRRFPGKGQCAISLRATSH